MLRFLLFHGSEKLLTTTEEILTSTFNLLLVPELTHPHNIQANIKYFKTIIFLRHKKLLIDSTEVPKERVSYFFTEQTTNRLNYRANIIPTKFSIFIFLLLLHRKGNIGSTYVTPLISILCSFTVFALAPCSPQ